MSTHSSEAAATIRFNFEHCVLVCGQWNIPNLLSKHYHPRPNYRPCIYTELASLYPKIPHGRSDLPVAFLSSIRYLIEGLKFQYLSCESCWFIGLDMGRKALQHRPREYDTLSWNPVKSLYNDFTLTSLWLHSDFTLASLWLHSLSWLRTLMHWA